MKCYTCNITAPREMPALADEANASKRDIEDEQGVYCDSDTVSDHSRPAHDADSCSQRPGHEHKVDGDPGNGVQADGAQYRGDDQRE
jgi:hypothetical protein